MLGPRRAAGPGAAHDALLASPALLRQFPDLPLVGKMTAAKPLPTYESRVDEAGNIEVLV